MSALPQVLYGRNSTHGTDDALASVRLVTDEEGAVVSRFDTDAYGELLAGSFDGVPGGMPYTWVGGLGVRFDALTGLYYMRQRWYSSQSLSFFSQDPIGLTGGANLYSYCAGNPVCFVDPTGLLRDVAKERAIFGMTCEEMKAAIRRNSSARVPLWALAALASIEHNNSGTNDFLERLGKFAGMDAGVYPTSTRLSYYAYLQGYFSDKVGPEFWGLAGCF